MPTRSAPVVIAGGGVIGAAVAREIALRGLPVLLVEAERFAYGASGRAAGLLTPPPSVDRSTPLGALLWRSFGMHLELAKHLPRDSGLDYDFRRYPFLRIAETEGEALALRREAELSASVYGPESWIEPAEVRSQLGCLALATNARLRGALLSEPAAQIDPARFTLALLADAHRCGAELLIGRVSGTESTGRRLSHVRIDGRSVAARALIVAMGPWSGSTARWLGSPVPVEPLRGQILRFQPDPDGPSDSPLPLLGFGDCNGNYPATKPSGLIYVGTSEERADFDTIPDVAAGDRILAWGRNRIPSLFGAELVGHTACLRPISADDLPILGPVPGLPGAFLATGHGRKGLLLAPVTGRLLAEWITNGHPCDFDPSPFSPQRFQFS